MPLTCNHKRARCRACGGCTTCECSEECRRNQQAERQARKRPRASGEAARERVRADLRAEDDGGTLEDLNEEDGVVDFSDVRLSGFLLARFGAPNNHTPAPSTLQQLSQPDTLRDRVRRSLTADLRRCMEGVLKTIVPNCWTELSSEVMSSLLKSQPALAELDPELGLGKVDAVVEMATGVFGSVELSRLAMEKRMMRGKYRQVAFAWKSTGN